MIEGEGEEEEGEGGEGEENGEVGEVGEEGEEGEMGLLAEGSVTQQRSLQAVLLFEEEKQMFGRNMAHTQATHTLAKEI